MDNEDEDTPRFSNGDPAPVDLMHGEAAGDEPPELPDERIYQDLKAYQGAGMIDYVLPTEPLGEQWIVGWNGQILKFLTKEGIVGFLLGIQVCAMFTAKLQRPGPLTFGGR